MRGSGSRGAYADALCGVALSEAQSQREGKGYLSHSWRSGLYRNRASGASKGVIYKGDFLSGSDGCNGMDGGVEEDIDAPCRRGE